MVERLLQRYWWGILLILLIPSFWALFIPGYYGASDDLHIAWLFELDKVVKMGQIPPRFVPDLSYGFGYPLFNFVFPLPFYIGEIFHLASFNFVDSIKAVFFISIIFSFLAMYIFLREFLDRGFSLTGAIIYIYAPYRAVDLYIRGAIGEIVAFIFLPLIVLSIIKLTPNQEIKKLNYKWIGVGSLAIGGLILSHNITAYMFLPFALFLFLERYIFLKINRKKALLQIISISILGLLLSIYFWLPVLKESALMKYDTVFNFEDHFPAISQLITPYWGYGASVSGPGDGMSFFLGHVSLVLLLAGILLLFIFRKKISLEEKLLLFWVIISFFISIFLMNYRSGLIWHRIPLLPYFQFPWRFLIMTTFLSPIFLIALKHLPYRKIIFVLLIVFTIGTSFSYFRPQDFLGRTDKYYLNRYIPTPVASLDYKQIQEEYLRLPKDTERRPNQDYPLIYGGGGLDVKGGYRLNDLDVVIETSSDKEIVVNYRKYFFPGWYAKIDEESTQILVGKPFGQISLLVPQGDHKIEINFKKTLLKIFLDLVSLAALIFSLLLILRLDVYTKLKWIKNS